MFCGVCWLIGVRSTWCVLGVAFDVSIGSFTFGLFADKGLVCCETCCFCCVRMSRRRYVS